VILFDETARDSCLNGTKFVDLLRSRGIHAGIKVDCGLVEIGGTDKETATTGLDGLGKRCAEYYAMGCRFAKWRAVVKIDKCCPSDLAI
jgi:fructose-bisphosphate aldolase class I